MLSNIGGFSTIGPRGENNLIKELPVTNDFGYAIYDSVVVAHDYADVSKQYYQLLSFQLTDARGNVATLHGANWSFSIIISTAKEETVFSFVFYFLFECII